MVFFTVCADIGLHSQLNLKRALSLLSRSLEKTNKGTTLYVYSNFLSVNSLPCSNITLLEIPPFQRAVYADPWLDLSFKKLFLWKHLSDNISDTHSPIWVDLDTIIVNDLSYMDVMDNVFIPVGGESKRPNQLFHETMNYSIPRSSYIQGNFWKIDESIYDGVIQTFRWMRSRNLTPRFDLQDIFTFMNYHVTSRNWKSFNVVGLNAYKNKNNGISIWSSDGEGHATEVGLQHLTRVDLGISSSYYPLAEIDFLSFTFNSLNQLIDHPRFQKLFGDYLDSDEMFLEKI